MAALANRYKFQKVPASFEEMQANPVTFMHGVCRNIAIEKFEIYNDGVIATSSSHTNEIDYFLDDFMSWSFDELGAVPSKFEPAQRRYESALVVKMNIQRDKILPWASVVQKSIRASFKSYGAPDVDLGFGTARLIPPQNTRGVAPFLLEPRAGRPEETGLYFSAAPLKTQDHLDLLTQLERTLGG